MNKIDYTKVSQSIIANQVALDFNHAIRFTPYYKREIKNRLNLLQKELIRAERQEFDKLDGHAEITTDEVYQLYVNVVKELTAAGFTQFENITALLKAFNKDPNSLEPVVNKILQS